MSHPSWVRGLKLKAKTDGRWHTQVAPLVGAWIETNQKGKILLRETVAPLVGAWIETD